MFLPTGLPTTEAYLVAAIGRLAAAAYAAGTGRAEARSPLAAHWSPGYAQAHPDFRPQPDATVAQVVRAALRAEPCLAALLLTVQVRAGVATLLGTLSNLRARQAAEQVARAVSGVRKVHNLLKVRSNEPDAAIQAQVRAALLHDPYVHRRRFAVQVANGCVQLSGVVVDCFDRERAADVAAGINGVVEVINHVHLAGLPTQAPPRGEAWDDQLAQRLHPYRPALFHSQLIGSGVWAGRVVLSGAVEPWLARQQAGRGANPDGATDVNNHLLISA